MLRALLVLGKYPAIVAAAAYALNHYAGCAIPVWAVCIGALATIPLVIGLVISFRRWRVSRAAERHGATFAPKVKGRWLGNLDVLKDVLHSFRTGYPGEQPGIIPEMRVDAWVFTRGRRHITTAIH